VTVFGRDASNFDGTIDYAGLGYFTHKSTEGTTITHDRYAARLNAARAAGVPVLGSYHVVRTPGNAGHGSLAAQLTYWLTYLDTHTPWWRTYPYWMMQIDAELWKYDAVSARVVKDFAALLVRSGMPGYKVTYASRGQYGDSLAGIVTDLWNANYNGGPGYPGDSWAPGWGPYSGKTPRFLQYTSTGYDHDAFRGSLSDLRALLSGGATPAPPKKEDIVAKIITTTDSPHGKGALYGTAGCGRFYISTPQGLAAYAAAWSIPQAPTWSGTEHEADAAFGPDLATLAVQPTAAGVLTDADLLAVQASAQAGARAGIDGATAVIKTSP